VIRNDNDGLVPENIKKAVAEKLEQSEATKKPVTTILQQPSPASIPMPWTQVSSSNIQVPQSSFKAAMEVLDCFTVLGNKELELLEPYRGEMEFPQLMMVLNKINQGGVDEQTQKAWCAAFECRKKDPLGLWNDSEIMSTPDSF